MSRPVKTALSKLGRSHTISFPEIHLRLERRSWPSDWRKAASLRVAPNMESFVRQPAGGGYQKMTLVRPPEGQCRPGHGRAVPGERSPLTGAKLAEDLLYLRRQTRM